MTAACGLVAFAIPDAACGDMPGHVLIAETKTTNINGIKFSFLEAPRAVTDTGDVFYQGNYSAPGVSYASGFWRGSGNVVQALASRGMTAPGGGVFQDVVSFTADHIANAGGYAVFMAEFRLPPSTTDIVGLYLVKPDGSSYRLAYEGQSAPGGGTFRDFQFGTSWSVGPGGQVVFYAKTQAGAGGGYYYARLNGTTPVVTAVALHGDAAPEAEGTFLLNNLGFGAQRMAVNDSGLVTFRSATTTNASAALYQ